MKNSNTPKEPTKSNKVSAKEVLKYYDDPKEHRRYYIQGSRKFWFSLPDKKASSMIK